MGALARGLALPSYTTTGGTTSGDVVGDPTFADAILDRIVHNAYQLALDGPSMRKLKANQLPEPGGQPSAIQADRRPNSSTRPQKEDQ